MSASPKRLSLTDLLTINISVNRMFRIQGTGKGRLRDEEDVGDVDPYFFLSRLYVLMTPAYVVGGFVLTRRTTTKAWTVV
jgi:hypothetical protein